MHWVGHYRGKGIKQCACEKAAMHAWPCPAPDQCSLSCLLIQLHFSLFFFSFVRMNGLSVLCACAWRPKFQQPEAAHKSQEDYMWLQLNEGTHLSMLYQARLTGKQVEQPGSQFWVYVSEATGGDGYQRDQSITYTSSRPLLIIKLTRLPSNRQSRTCLLRTWMLDAGRGIVLQLHKVTIRDTRVGIGQIWNTGNKRRSKSRGSFCTWLSFCVHLQRWLTVVTIGLDSLTHKTSIVLAAAATFLHVHKMLKHLLPKDSRLTMKNSIVISQQNWSTNTKLLFFKVASSSYLQVLSFSLEPKSITAFLSVILTVFFSGSHTKSLKASWDGVSLGCKK